MSTAKAPAAPSDRICEKKLISQELIIQLDGDYWISVLALNSHAVNHCVFFFFINLILKSQMSFIILLDFFNSREIDIFFYDYL